MESTSSLSKLRASHNAAPRPAETRDDRRRIEASYRSSQPDCCIKEVTRCVKLLRTELLLQYQYQSYEITTTICSNSTSRDSSQPSIASCVGKCWWLMCRFCVIRKKLSCHYSLSQNELLGLTESSQIPTYPAKVCWKFGLSSTVYKRLAQALIFDFLFETSWNLCAHISRINAERVDDRISSFKLSFRFWAACPAQLWICDTIDSIRCRCARCLARCLFVFCLAACEINVEFVVRRCKVELRRRWRPC